MRDESLLKNAGHICGKILSHKMRDMYVENNYYIDMTLIYEISCLLESGYRNQGGFYFFKDGLLLREGQPCVELVTVRLPSAPPLDLVACHEVRKHG